MVIEIDKKNKKLILYNDEVIVIPFNKISLLKSYMGNKKVKVVTKTEQLNFEQLYGKIRPKKNIGEKEETRNIPKAEQKYYLRSLKNRTILIEGMKFENSFDLKFIDNNLMLKIKQSNKLQNALKNKILQVVNDSRRKKIKQEYKKFLQKQEEDIKIKEAQIDKVLVEAENVEDVTSLSHKAGQLELQSALEAINQQQLANNAQNPNQQQSSNPQSPSAIPTEGGFDTMSSLMDAINNEQ